MAISVHAINIKSVIINNKKTAIRACRICIKKKNCSRRRYVLFHDDVRKVTKVAAAVLKCPHRRAGDGR
jgi:hypothetical protein